MNVREDFVKAVRLLSPKPGDIVVFHLDGATQQECDEFAKSMKPVTEHIKDVKFIAVERVDDITIVRPEPKTHPVEGDDLSRADWKGV